MFDREEVERLYHEEGLSQKEVAERLDTEWIQVLSFMKHEGIATRDSKPRYKKKCNVSTNNRGYVVADGGQVDTERCGVVPVHRVLAAAEYGFEAMVGDVEVHHKNGLTWDNRPDNIELVSEKEHKEMHKGDWTPEEV